MSGSSGNKYQLAWLAQDFARRPPTCECFRPDARLLDAMNVGLERGVCMEILSADARPGRLLQDRLDVFHNEVCPCFRVDLGNLDDLIAAVAIGLHNDAVISYRFCKILL